MAKKIKDISKLKERRRFGIFSPISQRILAINFIALCYLAGGVLYLGEYQDRLIENELSAMEAEANIFAKSLAETSSVLSPLDRYELSGDKTKQLVRSISDETRQRIRVFNRLGFLEADSRQLTSSYGGRITVQELPPLGGVSSFAELGATIYGWVVGLMPDHAPLAFYQEKQQQFADHYHVSWSALQGEVRKMAMQDVQGQMILAVGVPVQRYRTVMGAVMLSRSGDKIVQDIVEVRTAILQLFGVTLLLTTLLSLYLAGTIARPLLHLANAADAVRQGQGNRREIPDYTHRGDEIGELSGALRDMTESLWQRMDAIDSFAADVSHEIKNPLTSLKSATETLGRVKKDEHRENLMAVIQDDIKRLDRLITDISTASRLDAELSRSESAKVCMVNLVSELAHFHNSTHEQDGDIRVELDLPKQQNLCIKGIKSRLTQVLHNLIANAESFSPKGGTITISLEKQGSNCVLYCDDSGPGIPENKLEAIFDRFYTERPVEEAFGKHSGLGLSISKQIIEAHKGQITAQNRLTDTGEIAGARFKIILPLC